MNGAQELVVHNLHTSISASGAMWRAGAGSRGHTGHSCQVHGPMRLQTAGLLPVLIADVCAG